MDKYGLPEPPIELSGFKACAHGDRREVLQPVIDNLLVSHRLWDEL
jgi:hypothetical protein